MRTELPEIIYRGTWPGLGKMYNIKVKNGYTTIIVKSGQDLQQRAKETRDKFVGKSEDCKQMPSINPNQFFPGSG